jgi:hypothetical protein
MMKSAAMIDIPRMFTTEEQLLIRAPPVPTDTSGLYIDGGALFLFFLGKQKKKNRIIELKNQRNKNL